MKIKIRKMLESDITEFPAEFEKQGWHKPVEQYQMYYNEQENGTRKLFVAEVDGNAGDMPLFFLMIYRDRSRIKIFLQLWISMYWRNIREMVLEVQSWMLSKIMSRNIHLQSVLEWDFTMVMVLHKECMSSVDIFPTAVEYGLMENA